MKFFDRKEEVLDIQLTQYGKYLLSKGVFQPTYYAFFDDDIIYDSQYMSTGSETQLEYSTNASDRIRESIRPTAQYNFSGVETTFNQISQVKNVFDPFLNKVVQIELSQEEKLDILSKPPTTIENHYSLGLPMGTSEYNSDKEPAWDLFVHRGEITGSVLDYTGSSGLLKIPQIEMEVVYDTAIKQFSENINDVSVNSDNITVFPDNTYIEITKDHILIDFKEYNSLFENENFEIEVYEIVGEPTNNKIKDTLEPLYFVDGKKVVNEIFYSKDMSEKIEVTQNNVEYFFDVRVDDEITDDIGIRKDIKTNIYNTPTNDTEEPC